MKKISVFFLTAFLVIGGSIVSVNASQIQKYLSFPSINQIKNQNYSDIVAVVAGNTITGQDLTRQIEFEKKKWENVGLTKDASSYEKLALGQLISNALLDEQVQKRNLIVTEKEAEQYLKDIAKAINESNNDAEKVNFMSAIKASGFSTADEYIKSPDVIKSTSKVLARGKLKADIISSVEAPSDAEVLEFIDQNNLKTNDLKGVKEQMLNIRQQSVWETFNNSLLNDAAYDIKIGIDVKDYKDLYKDLYKELEGKSINNIQGEVIVQ
ncbi:SurA N-terminal domain-containing protein [Desulfitobacterium hafniense]|uniref:SurA N-terminal domain-containing protein n=1 Tax=Desulfitobacterium hafniense TaxID=49338 RepID=UPI00036390AC|nr:SurA N-terminal domain-containing protein [Desulfitobacterium hafniense]